jgi:hypothetical protein
MSSVVYSKAGADAAFAGQPPSGLTLVMNFIYTDPTIARPTAPAYVSLNWMGPAGSGGSAPTHMAAGDTWDLET